MSRTDAHEPYWVKVLHNGEESHDHSKGECDIHLARALDYSKLPGSHHRARCKKRVAIEVPCVHTQANKRARAQGVYTDDGALFGLAWKSYWIVPNPHPSYYGKNTMNCYEKETHMVFSHYEYDESIPCDCDNFPRTNCTIEMSIEDWGKFPHSPSTRVRQNLTITRPERRYIKNALQNAKHNWNSGIEDDDDIYEINNDNPTGVSWWD